jgi:hypothetical protein
MKSLILENRKLLCTVLSITAFSVFIFLLFTQIVDAAFTESATELSSGGVQDNTNICWGPDAICNTISSIIYGISLGIGGMFTGIGGMLLDLSIDQTVLKAGMWFNPDDSTGIGSTIYQMWAIIRDILNILFIFSFIYIGIKTILDANSSETQRSLGMLILAALLVNFSLFFTQVVIDFSNIAAIQVYNLIITGTGAGASAGDVSFDSGSIVGGFMNVADITSFFGDGSTPGLLNTMHFWKRITFSLMMMIFLIIAGIVFAMGAFLLIRRFITLILCMIFAPIMFAGWILPAFKGQQEEWRGKLLMNAFFAPAFLFMVYLSLMILDRLKSGLYSQYKTDAGFPDLMLGQQMGVGHFTIVFFFFLAIGFLWASMKVGEMMSIAGANSALKYTQKAIGGATAGLVARAGRNTVGRKFQEYAESDKAKDWASRSMVGKGILVGARKVGDNNFDLRSQGVGGGMIGEGRKGGYATVTKEIKEAEEKFAKSLGEIDDEDPVVDHLKHQEHERKEELDTLKEQRKETMKTYQKWVKDNPDATVDDKKAKKKELFETVDGEIEAKEKEVKAAKEAISHEKNRRVVGSAAAGEAYKKATKAFEEGEKARNEIANNLTKAIRENDLVAQKTFSEELRKQNENLKALKAERRTAGNNAGYAGRLQETQWYQSYGFARLMRQDHDAGKAIRKKYSKGSMKDDAHGADHNTGHGDDHGGGDHDNNHADAGHGGGHGH